MPNDAISGILNFIVYVTFEGKAIHARWLFLWQQRQQKRHTNLTKSERQSEIAKVYHFTRKLFDAFMSSATDPCYECQATLTENSTTEDQKLNNPSYEIQLRVAISQMKMNEQTNKDQTHNQTYVNSAFNNCLHVPVSERASDCKGRRDSVCVFMT